MNELWNWLLNVNPLVLLSLLVAALALIGGYSFLYFLEWSTRRGEKSGDDKNCP